MTTLRKKKRKRKEKKKENKRSLPIFRPKFSKEYRVNSRSRTNRLKTSASCVSFLLQLANFPKKVSR